MPTLHAPLAEESISPTAEYLQMAEQVKPTVDYDSTVEISNRGLRVGHAAARIGRAIGVSMLVAGVYGAHSAYDNLHDDRTTAIERVQALDLRAVDTELNTSLSTGRIPDTAPLASAVNQVMPGITAEVQTAQKDANQLSESLEVAGLGLLVGGLGSEEALRLKRRRKANTLHLQANGMTTSNELFSNTSLVNTARTDSSDDSPKLQLRQRQPKGEHAVPKIAERYLRAGLMGAAAVLLFGSPPSEAPAQQADSAISTVMPTDFLAKAIKPLESKEATHYTSIASQQAAATIIAKLPETEATLAHTPQIQEQVNQGLNKQIAAKLKANGLQNGTESGPTYFENIQGTFAQFYPELFNGGEAPELFAGLLLAQLALAGALRQPRLLGPGGVPVSTNFLNANLREKQTP